MKHLPKHLRPRWRYLALTIRSWPDVTLEERSVQQSLWAAAREFVGDAGSASVDLQVVSFQFTQGTGTAVVRTRRETVRTARAIIATVTTVDHAPVGVRVSGVGGTIRACEEKYLGDARVHKEESTVVYNNVERTAILESARVDIRSDDGWIAATERDLE